MGSPCPSDMYDGNLSLYEIDPHEVAAVARDAVGRLKTAFLFHVRRDAAACAALLAGLLAAPAPSAPSAPRDVDADLDRAVLRIACDMLDDVPAGDPRSVPAGAGRGQWRAVVHGPVPQVEAARRGHHRHLPGQLGGAAARGPAAGQAARLRTVL